jgi:hypothetical protein
MANSCIASHAISKLLPITNQQIKHPEGCDSILQGSRYIFQEDALQSGQREQKSSIQIHHISVSNKHTEVIAARHRQLLCYVVVLCLVVGAHLTPLPHPNRFDLGQVEVNKEDVRMTVLVVKGILGWCSSA